MIENFLRPPRTPLASLADALRVVGLFSVVAAALWWQPTDAGILAFALPALLLPRFVGVRPGFDIAFGVTVLVAAWSNVLDLYTSVNGWDLLVHFVATGVVAAMCYLWLARLRVVSDPATPPGARAPLVLVPALGLALSALWEMVEWIGYTFISDEIFVEYTDTISDMAIGGVGALLAGILVAFVRWDAVRPTRP